MTTNQAPTNTIFKPRIDLSKPRYDQSTYAGRLRHFIGLTDPRTLFVSRKGLEDAKQLIKDYNEGRSLNTDEEKLWNAKKIVDSTIHPDTGEPVFLPFRMSAFVPTNLVVVAGMLMPNPSIKSIIFWQWANQSVNVAINYANANKTIEMSHKETAVAYVAAVTTSCLLAVGLTEAVPRLPLRSTTKVLLTRLVPFAAVAAAGTVNVFLMRGKEVKEGIDVFDSEGNTIGKSPKAGLMAVSQVAVSRILTSFPVMVIPPLLLTRLQRTQWLKARPRLVTPINLGLIGASLMTSLPMAIAAFPRIVPVEAKKLEPAFADAKDSEGKKLDTLYYNRGL